MGPSMRPGSNSGLKMIDIDYDRFMQIKHNSFSITLFQVF